MGRKSTVWSLPRDVREALIQRVIESNFSGYEGHEDWLKAQGFSIGKSSIHRAIQQLEEAEQDKRATLFSLVLNDSVIGFATTAEQDKRATLFSLVRSANGNQAESPHVVLIIDAVTGHTRFVSSQAPLDDIEAAVRGLDRG